MTEQDIKDIVISNISPEMWNIKDENSSACWGTEIVYSNELTRQHPNSISMGNALEEIVKDILSKNPQNKLMPVVMGSGMESVSIEDFQNGGKSNVTLAELNRLIEASKRVVRRVYTRRTPTKEKRPKKVSFKIVTRLNLSAVEGELFTYVKEMFRKKERISQEKLLSVCENIYNKYKVMIDGDSEIKYVGVDVIVVNGCWYVLEVKNTGDCDSIRVPATIVKSLMLPIVCLGDVPKKAVLGIISKNREMLSDGSIKPLQFEGYLDTDVCLIDERFGDWLLPPEISWEFLSNTILEQQRITKEKAMGFAKNRSHLLNLVDYLNAIVEKYPIMTPLPEA